MNKSRKKMTGYTLLEIVIAMAIMSAVMGMIYMIYGSGKDLYETKVYQTDLQAQARQAMDFMVKELRQATRTSSHNPSPDLSIPSAPNNKQVQFYLPEMVNGTAVMDTGELDWDTNNMIRYQYIPGQKELRRNDGGNLTTLCRDVTDVRFFDTTLDPSLGLQEIKIVLSLSKTTPRQHTISLNLTSLVRLRN